MLIKFSWQRKHIYVVLKIQICSFPSGLCAWARLWQLSRDFPAGGAASLLGSIVCGAGVVARGTFHVRRLTVADHNTAVPIDRRRRSDVTHIQCMTSHLYDVTRSAEAAPTRPAQRNFIDADADRRCRHRRRIRQCPPPGRPPVVWAESGARRTDWTRVEIVIASDSRTLKIRGEETLMSAKRRDRALRVTRRMAESKVS